MSSNVNILIEKMNQEALKKKKLGAALNTGLNTSKSRGSTRIKAAEQEIVNNDKAVTNLMKEHAQLRRRLEEVQNPEFLINLKQQLKEAD